MDVTPLEPLVNYNDCVLEKPIVDPDSIVSKRKYDISKLNVDMYEDLRRQYWKQQTKIQQQLNLDRLRERRRTQQFQSENLNQTQRA